jgi:HAD superfamily hydrolase (TIGR01509 family)
MKEIPKAFNSNTKELEIYKIWEESGLSNPETMEKRLEDMGVDSKEPFTITLPPPNANGNLHLGHTCGYSFMDAIGRYKRMTGHPTLLLPGKDHAGIQTESAFSKKLKEEGKDKWEMGRDEFYKECYEFCLRNMNNAREQEKRIGLSADFSREKFTLQEDLTKTIYETFEMMFKDGLVYRDKRIINQCPYCKTALADVDTEHEERRGIFAYIKYPVVEKEDMSNIKAVVIDQNEVIAKETEDRNGKLIEILNTTEEDFNEKFFKQLKKHFKEGEGIFDENTFWNQMKKDFDSSEEQIQSFKEIWINEYTFIPGAKEFLRKVKEKGFKIIILSNGFSGWRNSWNEEIKDLLDGVVFSGDVEFRGKPYPEIFKYTEEKIGLSGNEIFFVDNRYPNIKTAKELGWKTIYFDNNYDEIEDYLFNGQRYITVATTRPETMLGDTAVAVNPEDERYKEFVGKKVYLPIANREIPVIADSDVDMELGTGAVKVTPAHSPIDFELGKKHDLEIINVIDEDGKMTGDIPEKFKGMETVECSKALCKELEEQGLLTKIENIKHEVTICERCKTAIEPIISNQWYLNVEDLSKRALEALRNGDVKVIPDGQQKALEYFFENIQPWCISRQLWWGHRIPVWYNGSKELFDWLNENKDKTVEDFEKETGEKANGTGEIYIGIEKPNIQGNWEEETDVFDTWFSSGQWPFSTLGGPESEDFKKYYPTQMMIHARDILFWWSARMLMMGLYRTNEVPFPTIFLTGMILAADGSKMSKSKNNGVEPKEVFEKYGADSLRLWYYTNALPGSNAPLREEKIKGNRNFVNKIWNASRFILMNIDDSEISQISKSEVKDTERIQLTKNHVEKVSKYIEKYQFNLGAEEIREFFWHTFCDKWIEEIKTEIKDQEIGSDIRIEKLSELLWILKMNLKIMHPFIPFVTEAVWQELKDLGLVEGLLMEQQI